MKKYDITITKHAIDRAWQRFRMDASQLKYNANKSLDEGIDVLQDEILRPMALKKAEKHNASGMYLYQGNIYMFKDEALVSVMPLVYLHEYQDETD